MTKRTKLTLFIFILIALSALFRLPNLTNLPAGFFGDEAALVYNGWSILTTGRDEWGKFLPLTLKSFEDYKPAIYSYATIPFVATLGPTITAARLPAALAGITLAVAVFLLIEKRTKNSWLAFLVGAVIAVSPWHWEISRTAIEAGLAVTLSLLSLLAFQSKKPKNLIIGATLALLALFTYHSTRVVLPLLLISSYYFGQIKQSKTGLLAVASLFVLGLTLTLLSGPRFKQISIFNDQGAVALRMESIREDGVGGVPLWKTRLFHNKPVSWARSFTTSYLENISPSYFFIGGAKPPRVRIPNTGQFLLVFLPFFIIGLVTSLRRFKKYDQWLGAWFLIAPLPAAMTSANNPHTYRTLFLIVPMAFYIGLGLEQTIKYLKNLDFSQLKLLQKYQKQISILCLAALFLLITANTLEAWDQYSVHQQLNKPWLRQYGYKELVSYLNELPEEQKTKITITNREQDPYIFFLLYNRIHPRDYQAWPEKRLAHQAIEQGALTWQMFEYTFHEEKCPYDEQDADPNHVYVVGLNCELPDTYKRVRDIEFQDGVPMFHIDRPTGEQIEVK